MLGENLMICFNVLDAARRAGVERILYTSTVTVYPPMEVYREDLVWSGNPHPGDQYAAWAKRMAEKFIEAQEIQYGSRTRRSCGRSTRSGRTTASTRRQHWWCRR
jgi:nucleoside-diphosphate-sugar epimerase